MADNCDMRLNHLITKEHELQNVTVNQRRLIEEDNLEQSCAIRLFWIIK